MRNSFDNFDRRFNRMRRFVIGFIATVFVLIIGYWVAVGIIAGKAISDPEGTAEKVGKFGKSLKEGFEKGFNESPDTLVIDTLKTE